MKEKTTRKNVMENHNVIIKVGFCNLQFLLKHENEQFYTVRAEGWGADIYSFGSIAIVTGYAPFGNVSPSWDFIDSYEKRAIAIDNSNLSYENKKIETKKLLNEFLADMKIGGQEMKRKTATFIGYSYDASYYINNDPTGYDYYNTPGDPAGDRYQVNADAVISSMQADYGPSAYIAGCSNTSFFDTPDYGMQLQGDCLEYTIIYNPIETIAEIHDYSFRHSDGDLITGAYWNMKSALTFPTREKLLPWQARGLMYTASGYGKKIPTRKQIFVLNKWRRIYCDIFSNSGVCYVIVDGQEINVDDCNME